MIVQPLLNRPNPYPDETLASWLWRLAKQNHLDSPLLLLRYLHETGANPAAALKSVNGLRDEQVLSGLAALTRHTNAEIQQHTSYRFTHIFTYPSVKATPKGANASLHRELWSSHFAWCPACIADLPYVRSHWHSPLVVCCEQHKCWLREICPQCNRVMTEMDIVCRRCQSCGYWLEQALTPSISAADPLLHLQSTLMNWLYGQAAVPSLGLPDVPANVLLYVLLGLRYAAQRAGNGWVFHHTPSAIPVPNMDIQEQRLLTVFERGCLYATAFLGLQRWPHGFFAFLDAYRRRPMIAEETGLRREFASLHASWLMRFWRHPAFDFIQTAYNDYLVAHVPTSQILASKRIHDYPDLVARVAHLTLFQTATQLKTSTTCIRRLMNEGHLTAVRFERDNGVWFSREEVNRLQQQWAQYMTPTEVAHTLGLRVDRARVLIKASLLQQVPASEGVKWQLTSIYRHSVDTLLRNLKKHTAIRTDEELNGISLADVCIRNGSVGLGLPQLLRRVCEGTLLACHPNEALLPLSALWFEPEAVANLSGVVKAEQEWLNLQEVEGYLGVGRDVLHHLISAGLLQPALAFGRKKLFSRQDVLALRDRYTTTQQAALLLNIPEAYIFPLIQHKMLVPISGPSVNGHNQNVFDRAHLIAWQETYVLHYEMKRLTADIDGLMCFLKKEHIQPIVRLPNVYLRKGVMAALDSMKTATS